MYGKLFEQMFDGTLATRGPWQALVTFQQLVILADRHGQVDMTPEAIARRTTIPIAIVKKGLQALEKSDPESRTPDEEGRRIVRLSDTRPWGWRIVNYDHYRKIRSEEERREYHRTYMRKRRAGLPNRSVKPNVKVSTRGDQCQPIAVSSMQYPPSPPSRGDSKPKRRQKTDCPSTFNVTDELSVWAQDTGLPADRVCRRRRNSWTTGKAKANSAPTGWRRGATGFARQSSSGRGKHERNTSRTNVRVD